VSTTRTIQQIIVNLDQFGTASLIEASAVIDQIDSGISGSFTRQYRAYYTSSLGPAAQARVDAFVADVGTFIDAKEPIVP